MAEHEIPSDGTVCQVLDGLKDPTARRLLDALVTKGYDNRDSQRVIQRCLDRGKISLGAGLRLKVTGHLKVAA